MEEKQQEPQKLIVVAGDERDPIHRAIVQSIMDTAPAPAPINQVINIPATRVGERGVDPDTGVSFRWTRKYGISLFEQWREIIFSAETPGELVVMASTLHLGSDRDRALDAGDTAGEHYPLLSKPQIKKLDKMIEVRKEQILGAAFRAVSGGGQ